MRLKKEGSCINIENEVDAWSRKTGAHASLFRKRPAGRVPPNLPETHPTIETWCPATKEQGLAGSEAPRLPGRRSTRHRPHRRRTLPPATAQPGAGGPTTQAEPRTRPHPEAEKSEPVARAWCRIPRRRSAQPLGQSPHPAGALPCHVRPAEASSKPAPAPAGGQPTYTPLPARQQ